MISYGDLLWYTQFVLLESSQIAYAAFSSTGKSNINKALLLPRFDYGCILNNYAKKVFKQNYNYHRSFQINNLLIETSKLPLEL